MRLLIIEDEIGILNFLVTGLKCAGFAVDATSDGEEGLKLATSIAYDLLILDIILPKYSGHQICQQIRNEGKHYPIIITSVQDTIQTKVDLFKIGADDYLCKPFSFDELLARVRNLLKRPAKIIDEVLELDDLSINTRERTAIRGKTTIKLTKKEFSILEYLMRNLNKALSRTIILEHVWDREANPFSNTIETHIANLRNKIDKEFNQKLIHTVPGIGYKLSKNI